ncbi:hypothetical protein, conserved [Eimeria necatrix]|uniref:Uncharacterized protein n=1 Tax=Eimeria necatrix TaxID=51315 RepID=U6MQY1_9EIME|nr:hypothetical protein, conserved [Eimeria necatrix]CDJ66436.1 hypothetical protein, conserved [Eimeria necatrix]
MSLQDLYCLAYAPLQGTCLMDLEEDDYTPEVLQKELKYLQRLTATSLEAFSKFFDGTDVATAEGAAALYCMTSFFNRLQVISLRAGTLAGELIGVNKIDYHDTLREITTKAKAEGLEPKDNKEAEWDFPTAAKGRVEFRHSVSMVAPKDSDGAEEGGVSHQPVKPEFTRKKVRKATGYAKFNFSVDDLQDSPNKSDDDTEETNVGRDSRSSASKTPSSVMSESRPSSTAKKEDGSPFSFFCCLCPNGGRGGSDNEVVRRSSSVSLGTVEEIQDKDADANWHDSERHSGRFARIRGRIPTGHASLMKSSSDDMLDLLLSEDSEEGRRARELLLHNTQLNSSSPPISVRSWDCDSSSSPRGLSGAATEPSDDISLTENLTANERQGQSSDSAPFSSSGGVLCILECHIASSS